MSDFEDLNYYFDDLLYQIARGNTHEKLEKNIIYGDFQQIGEWQLKFGFKFNVYGNDHLIDGKPHFHFENKEKNIFCKIDFEANILESSGSGKLSGRILKELKYFLSKEKNNMLLVDIWNSKNPTYTI